MRGIEADRRCQWRFTLDAIDRCPLRGPGLGVSRRCYRKASATRTGVRRPVVAGALYEPKIPPYVATDIMTIQRKRGDVMNEQTTPIATETQGSNEIAAL